MTVTFCVEINDEKDRLPFIEVMESIGYDMKAWRREGPPYWPLVVAWSTNRWVGCQESIENFSKYPRCKYPEDGFPLILLEWANALPK